MIRGNPTLNRLVFLLVAAVLLRVVGSSVTDGKGEPVVPAAPVPQLLQVPYDIETGKPLPLVVGAPDFTLPTYPAVEDIRQTNVLIGIQIDALYDFLEALRND